MLEALVATHLRRHGGGPEWSLNDLSSLGSVRAVLEHLDDTDLTSSLAGTATGGGESTREEPAGTGWEPAGRSRPVPGSASFARTPRGPGRGLRGPRRRS